MEVCTTIHLYVTMETFFFEARKGRGMRQSILRSLIQAMANDGMLMATAAPVSRLTDLARFDPMVSDCAQERESLFISLNL